MAKFQYYLGIALIFCSGIFKTSEAYKISEEGYAKLRLVSMIFRHGNRTMEQQKGETYPNDPYKDYNIYPEGQGQLTIGGKEVAYKLGRLLRKMYDYFLGDVYYQPNIYARSTSSVRCKMTLQLVLAALYPPAEIQTWHPHLAWQPVDIQYTSVVQDGLLFPMNCHRYIKAYIDMLQTPEAIKEIGQFNNLMKYTSKYTGTNITNIIQLFALYQVFATQSSLGLILPEWSQQIFPEGELLDAAILQYNLFSYNDELIRLNGGTLLYKIIDDMNKVINGNLTDLKLNLFCAHEVTVAAMLHALGIFDNTVPAYTSGVIIELHEIDGEYFIKVLHYLGIPSKIIEVSIPGCEKLCPYNKFVQLRSATTATGDDPKCPLTINTNQNLIRFENKKLLLP